MNCFQLIMVKQVYLLLGSNRGQRELYLERALELIRQRAGRIVCCSSVYETEPWGFSDPVKFLNIAIEIETGLDPKALLREIKQMEHDLGREKPGQRFQPRIIDIDILFYDSIIYNEDSLIIPHPHLPVRRFALVPLHEIAPGFTHPVLNMTIACLLDSCEDDGEVLLHFGEGAGYNSPSSAKLK